MRAVLVFATALLVLADTLAFAGGVSAKREAVSSTNFSRPHDLILSPDGRLLFVTDMDNSQIKELDPKSLKIVGAFGINELSRPHDLVFGPDGLLYIADTAQDRIAIYKMTGAIASPVGQIAGLDGPEGLDFGSDGRLYVANTSGGSVVVLDNGKIVGETSKAAGIGFIRPHDLDVDAKGQVYVCDSGNDRIVILDANLKFLKEFKGPPYNFHEPKYIGFDDAGRLYVADEYSNQLKIFDAKHRPVLTIGDGEPGTEGGRLRKPEGVTVQGDQMWVSDTYNDRILRYRLSFDK
jgi:DNA-binding beta-propeller fold protein YncE